MTASSVQQTAGSHKSEGRGQRAGDRRQTSKLRIADCRFGMCDVGCEISDRAFDEFKDFYDFNDLNGFNGFNELMINAK